MSRFSGVWRVARRIVDLRAGRVGRFRGEARFEADPQAPGELIHSERGELLYGGVRMAAEQRYLWRLSGDGAVEVRFADGRAFCLFALEREASGALRGAASHFCAPDWYEGRLSLRDAEGRDARGGAWGWRWRATGPAKDYVSDSVYRRAGAG